MKNAHLPTQRLCSQTQIGMLPFICHRLQLYFSLHINPNFTTVMPSFPPCFFLLLFCFSPPLFSFFFSFSFSFPLPLPFVIFLLPLAFYLLPSSFLSSWTSAISFTVFSAHQKSKPHWATRFFPSNRQHIFLIIMKIYTNTSWRKYNLYVSVIITAGQLLTHLRSGSLCC